MPNGPSRRTVQARRAGNFLTSTRVGEKKIHMGGLGGFGDRPPRAGSPRAQKGHGGGRTRTHGVCLKERDCILITMSCYGHPSPRVCFGK